jgi:hypothetical protein
VDGSSDKVAGRGPVSVTTGHRLSKRDFRHAEGLPDGPVRFWATAHTSSPELLILHGLRVKGMADEAAVAERFALDCDLVRSRRANAGQDLTSKLRRTEVDGERPGTRRSSGSSGCCCSPATSQPPRRWVTPS